MIRSVAVRNDVNPNGVLLHPSLAPGAYLRADQLLFFTQGVESVQSFRSGAGTLHRGQGLCASAATRLDGCNDSQPLADARGYVLAPLRGWQARGRHFSQSE